MDEVPNDLFEPESIRLERQGKEIEKWTKREKRKASVLHVNEEKDYCPECAHKLKSHLKPDS